MREIITLQIGPFANWAGSHFWNVQDDARHPPSYDENGDPVYEDEQADTAILYRSTSGRSRQLTPRLVLCDTDENFGSLNSEGMVNNARGQPPPGSYGALSWGGSVQEVVREQRAAHAFVQMMGAPVVGDAYADEIVPRDEEEEDEYNEDKEERSPPRRRDVGQLAAFGVPAAGRRDEAKVTATNDPRIRGTTGAPAAAAEAASTANAGGSGAELGAELGAEAEGQLRAAVFSFERSVEFWSDYLQAKLHARSLAPLKPHVCGYSSLARFPDGASIVQKEEDMPGGPHLVERVRRFLEECDTIQGFHLLLDADSGFGGAAAALLTQIRDDYSRAPCLALGLGTLLRPERCREALLAEAPLGTVSAEGLSAFGADGLSVGRDGLGNHTYTPALNDALSLTAFSELACTYVPLYGAGALRSALERLGPSADAAADSTAGLVVGGSRSAAESLYRSNPVVYAPPMLQPRSELRYHTAAPIATLLDALTLPYRARTPRGSMSALVAALAPRGGMHLCAAYLGMPIPPDTTLALREGWLAPLLPFQRAPHVARAFEQHISWLGQPGGGRAIAPLVPSLMPCHGGGGTLFVRRQPFALPLSYPQFFDAAVGVHGELGGAFCEELCRQWRPPLPLTHSSLLRPAGVEVLDVPAAAVLQSTTGLLPSLRRVSADWMAEKRAAERAASAEGWAARDEMSEITEHLATLRDNYADGEEEGEGGGTSVRGFSGADWGTDAE